MELIKGEKYTLIFVGEMSALTVKLEVTFESQEQRERYVNSGLHTMLWFKVRGKRKIQGVLMNKAFLVFKGWDLPLRVDTDGSSFRGNACLNFVGNIDEIRAFIDAHNLNENANKGVILCVPESIHATERERAVYPEIARTISHAVVRRILDAASASAHATQLERGTAKDGE